MKNALQVGGKPRSDNSLIIPLMLVEFQLYVENLSRYLPTLLG